MQEPGPHEREQQQREKQSGPRRRGEPADAGRRGSANGGSANGGDAPMGTGGVAGPCKLRHRGRALRDVLAQLGVGQDRQHLRRPPRQGIVTPALAAAALAEVPGHGQPKGGRQHHDGAPAALLRIAVALSIGQYLPQFPAPGRATRLVQASLPGRERGDLERAQYRLPVLAAQPPNLCSVRAEFPCCAPVVQASRHEQVEELLPGFGQRGRDLLKPVPQPSRALPLSLGLPQPVCESGVGLPPVARGYRRHPVHGHLDPIASRMPQLAYLHVQVL